MLLWQYNNVVMTILKWGCHKVRMWFSRFLEWSTDTFGWLSQASSRCIIIIIIMNIKSENHDHRPNKNTTTILIANMKLRSWALWSLRAALASLSVSLPWASETLGERTWSNRTLVFFNCSSRFSVPKWLQLGVTIWCYYFLKKMQNDFSFAEQVLPCW